MIGLTPEFAAKSERALKTQETRKHCRCNLCDYICDEEKELKKQRFDEHTLEYPVVFVNILFGKLQGKEIKLKLKTWDHSRLE